MQEMIKQHISEVLPDATVYVASPDGTHFSALVISPSFEGLLLVKQHKLVMNALREKFNDDSLHALQLKTFTPEKWEQSKHEYNLKED